MINLDFVGTFVFIAGFIFGLGSVTVVDIHGLLGRKSSYWTEATIRTHKVTKPLIWLGAVLAILGGFILYRGELLTGIPLYHLIIAILVILNGIFLSTYVSPYLLKLEKEGKQKELLPQVFQNKIAVSFVLSALLWWGGLLLFVLYISK